MTFVASANVVELSGGTPVFVDVEPDTGLIDLDRRGGGERADEGDHAGPPRGAPVDMDRVNYLQDRHGVAVIEDARTRSGASGAERGSGPMGTSPPTRST